MAPLFELQDETQSLPLKVYDFQEIKKKSEFSF